MDGGAIVIQYGVAERGYGLIGSTGKRYIGDFSGVANIPDPPDSKGNQRDGKQQNDPVADLDTPALVLRKHFAVAPLVFILLNGNHSFPLLCHPRMITQAVNSDKQRVWISGIFASDTYSPRCIVKAVFA